MMGGVTQPRTLIIRTAGTNCDAELAHAFELAGATTQTIHVNRLIGSPGLLEGFELVGFPGGFSFGDDVAAGRIFANLLKHRLEAPIRAAIGRGVPMIGICNGFQVLVKMGLLPDPAGGTQQATLADNESGRFVDRWCGMDVPTQTQCVWTKGLGRFDLPVAHGEGRFTASAEVLARLEQNGQIAVRYAEGENPNGSVNDIAGVCDPTGLVLGLMPHPERFVHATHHPQWTRRAEATVEGLAFFQNAVAYVKDRVAAGV